MGAREPGDLEYLALGLSSFFSISPCSQYLVMFLLSLFES